MESLVLIYKVWVFFNHYFPPLSYLEFSRYLPFNIGGLCVIHKLQTVSWADHCITENCVESPSKRKVVL